MKKIILVCPLILAIIGCNLEPRYDPPCVDRPEHWKNEQAEMEAIPEVANWWEIFQDCQLTEFIQKAIENNQNLIAAKERIDQARDIAMMKRSKLFPQIDLSPTYSNAGVLTQLYGPNLPYTPFVTREHQMEYSLPFVMTYELDLWGKIRSDYKAAQLNAQAKEEAYKALQLVLTTELANDYFQLRLLDAEIDLSHRIIATREKKLELNLARFRGQLINFSEVTIAEQQLEFMKSECYKLKEKRALFENMIAVLLGIPASEFSMPHQPMTAPPPKIPAGVPCAMLLRRPDLAEMERTVASIHAKLGVAYAAYFPSVDLFGALGFLSPLLNKFLTGMSRLWAIGTNINEVVFDGLARYYNVQLTWSQYREAVANYRQGVLNAFQELENSLSNLDWIARQMESTGKAVAAAAIDRQISFDRYRYGVSSYLPVTEKEEQELENEQVYLILTSRSYLNTIQLIKALGGGW